MKCTFLSPQTSLCKYHCIPWLRRYAELIISFSFSSLSPSLRRRRFDEKKKVIIKNVHFFFFFLHPKNVSKFIHLQYKRVEYVSLHYIFILLGIFNCGRRTKIQYYPRDDISEVDAEIIDGKRVKGISSKKKKKIIKNKLILAGYLIY